MSVENKTQSKDIKMRDLFNIKNSLAQGKYLWGIIKIGKLNSKFAVGEDKSFPTFQSDTKYTICMPTLRIFVQGILFEYGKNLCSLWRGTTYCFRECDF